MALKRGALVILPNLIGETPIKENLPDAVEKEVASLDGLIAESETAGRRFLGHFIKERAALVPISVFSKKTKEEDIDFYLEPIQKGEKWGLVSDAGLPCIADPGSKLVMRARKVGIKVKALPGPSSIMLSLQLSGLSGQHFTFHGYLPKEHPSLIKKIKEMEKTMKTTGATQIAIEAPYRNNVLLGLMLDNLSDDTLLSVMWDLTLPSEGGMTESVATWKKLARPQLDKRPSVFLIGRD